MTNHNSFIPGWYAILPIDAIPKRKPLAIQRFDMNLVVWRDKAKKIFVMQDRCPHRGAKLSLGKVCKDTIVCPYHGFAFNQQGQCQFAPEFEKAIPGLQVQSFVTHIALDMLWIYWGDVTTEFSYPDLENIHQTLSGYSQTQRVWQSHITYCIENQLDYTHLRFVHNNTIGRNFVMPKHPIVDCNDHAITVSLQPNTTTMQFFFPNVWVLHISKKMKLMLFFVPIDQHTTLLVLRSYRSFLTNVIIKKAVDVIMNIANLVILKQDQQVVASQGKQPSYENDNQDLLMSHDKAIKFFREKFNC